MWEVGRSGGFLLQVLGFFFRMPGIDKGLPDHGQCPHERIRIDLWGLFFADRIKGHDLGDFLFQNQVVGVSVAQENAGSRSAQDSLGGGQVGYRETMFAKVLPGRLVGLKLIDTLSFGVNPGYLEARAFFAGVGTGGRGAVKGQIRGGFEVLLVVSEIK